MITSQFDGKRINGICVSAFDLFGDNIRTALSDARGNYRLDSLPPTQIRVGFLACGARRSAYRDQYWKNARSLDRADPIKLTNGKVVRHIDAVLAAYGDIFGTVYDSSGKHPLAGICVQAESAILHSVLYSYTSVTGTYRIQVVSPVTQSYFLQNAAADWYTISFHDCTSGVDADQWWNGSAGGTLDPAGARPTHLDVGQELTGVDANLHAGGNIAGAVRDPSTGFGVPGACVTATANGRPTKGVRADVSGRYHLGPLAPGAYSVLFADCARGKLSSIFWHNTSDPAAAQPVQVTAKQTVNGINANLPKTGSLAGTVVDDVTGEPLSYMCLTVTGNEPNPIQVQTDYRGRFRVSRLSVGAHIVSIRDCAYFPRTVAYLPTYYQHALDAAHAKVVTIRSQTNTQIVAKMLRSGGIAGVVRQKTNHKPIVNTCVDILDPHTGSPIAEMRTSITGAYRLAVPPGSYQVRFSSCGGGVYLAQYYNGSPDLHHATKVTVGPSNDVSGIDGSLSRGGEITGRITDPFGGYPYFETCAQARTGKSPGRVVAEGTSDWTGQYSIGGLPPGRYHIEFGHCHGQLDYYAPTFYFNAPTYDGSTPVAVATNETVTGIDGRLDYGGAISGSLRDSLTGAPAIGVCVEAVSNDPDELPQFSETYEGGQYYLYNLPPGQYHLRFGNHVTQYGFDCEQVDVATSWYPKAIDEASSKPVNLGLEQYLSGVDGVVFQPAQVTGYVTSAATGSPVAGACGQAYGSSGEVRGRAEMITAGVYAVFDLPPDTYRVRIASCGSKPFVPQFFDGASDLGSATPIPLKTGEVRSDIDAALQPGGP